jgi:hypothetical protein
MAVVSDNLRDFILLNTVSESQRTRDGNLRHVPVFTVEDLRTSLSSDVSYPENDPRLFEIIIGCDAIVTQLQTET